MNTLHAFCSVDFASEKVSKVSIVKWAPLLIQVLPGGKFNQQEQEWIHF